MSKEFVGLDIGTYSVKAFIRDAKDGSFVAFDQERIWPESADAAEVPGDDEQTQIKEAPAALEEADAEVIVEAIEARPWVKALSELMSRHEFEEARYATILTEGNSATIFTEVPFGEPSKVRSVLPHLLVDKIPISVAEVTYDFMVQTQGEEHEALVGYAQSTDIEAYLDQLGEAGIDPVLLGNPELMLGSAAFLQGLGGGEAVALVDLGHENTRVVIVQGSDILLARRIQRGGAQVTAALAEAFEVELPEAERIKHEYAAIVDSPPNDQMKTLSETAVTSLNPIVRDLRRSFQSLLAKRKVSVSHVYLCGGTSRLRNIDQFLTGALGVQVSLLRSAELESPEAAMCHALAGSQVHGARPSVNLRTAGFIYRGRSSYVRRQAYLMAAALFIIGLTVVAALMVQKAGHEAKRDAMKAALQNHTKKLFGERLTKKTEIMRRLEGSGGDSMAFVPKVSAFELMYNITKTLNADTEIKLSRFEVDVDRQIIQFMGETSDAQAVDSIVSDLEKIECVKEIRQDKLKVKSDGRADFELQISTECS